MKFQEVIDKRHSVREFEKKKISKNILKKLVRNATKAPSGANTQPWRFYIIQDKKKRDKIANLIREYYNLKGKKLIKKSKYKELLKKFYFNLGDAPCFMFIYYENLKGFPYQVSNQSTILAGSNVINSAVVEKLGTCWINTFFMLEEKLNKILKIPANYILSVPIIIGYPKKGYIPLKRSKKKISEVIKLLK